MIQTRPSQKIAIIGSGISGLTAAYLLSPMHDVHMFEASPTVGGHAHTHTVHEAEQDIQIDMGFIVFNTPNYPTFNKLLGQLQIESIDTDMSFGFYNPKSKFYWASDFPKGIFAHPKSRLSLSYYKMLLDIVKFSKQAKKDLETLPSSVSLGKYLLRGTYGKRFIREYLIPMGAAIWSTSESEIVRFPAKHYLQFWSNHALLEVGKRPQWRTIKGGSQTYVNAIVKTLKNPVRTSTSVLKVHRSSRQVTIDTISGSEDFDLVIFACHADQAYKMIANPNSAEEKFLKPWAYSKNKVVLHTDASMIAPNRNAWGAWNYHVEPHSHVTSSVTYYMNRLQSLKTDTDYFVSLNQPNINCKKVIKELLFEHPCYTQESMATQAGLPQLNGHHRSFFCGSYFGWGFHEDGAYAGAQVAKLLGGAL